MNIPPLSTLFIIRLIYKHILIYQPYSNGQGRTSFHGGVVKAVLMARLLAVNPSACVPSQSIVRPLFAVSVPVNATA